MSFASATGQIGAAVTTSPAVEISRMDLYGQVWPGDFNGDGVTDLAANGHVQSEIVIAIGNGDGTFQVPIGAGFVGTVLRVSDINNDGRRDIVAVSTSSTTSVNLVILPGNGNGTFGTPVHVATLGNVTFALTADFNSDGKRDLAVGSEGYDLRVYAGNADFTFGTPVLLTTGAWPHDGIAADLNNDGRTDIAVANRYGVGITVFINSGGLGFVPRDIALGYPGQPTDVTAADVNGDGKLDLIVTAAAAELIPVEHFSDGHVYVLKGNGDGTFGAPANYNVAPGAFQVVAGDFTRDGIVDVATANRSSIVRDDGCGPLKTWDSITILPGNGDGTFAAGSSFSLGDQANPAADAFRNSVLSLNTSDLNADGATDLIVSHGAIVLNAPSHPNSTPGVNAGPDQVTWPGGPEIHLSASASDPDDDMLTYVWTHDASTWTSTLPAPCTVNTPVTLATGVNVFTIVVSDGHGGQASDSVTVMKYVEPPTPRIAVTAPSAGEVVSLGVAYTVRWTASSTGALTRFDVQYSVDNGAHFTPIVACTNLSGVVRACVWPSPGPAAEQAIVRVSALDSYGLTGRADSGAFRIAGLPDGWSHRDIGNVGVSGSASEAGGTFTIEGAGADIWGTADAFHFVHRTLTGDGAIVARVTSIENVAAWVKAGVMMRAALTPGAAHAFMLVSAGKGLAFQRRPVADGITTSTSGGLRTAPAWVRIARVGNVITAAWSSDGASWTTVAQQTMSLPQTIYVGLAVSSHDATALATATFDSVIVTAALPPGLPAGWGTADVGVVGTTGSATESAGTFTVKGAGADVWGTADGFRFAYQRIEGDATIVARVATVQYIAAWTKAGVMIRETLDASSAQAFMLVSAGKGLAFQRRVATAGVSTHTSGGAGIAPQWVKLQRIGSTIAASVSSDGSAWTEVGRDTFTMGSTVLIGLAVSSHTTTTLATGTFDHVAIATPAPALPPGWQSGDIGAVGRNGSAVENTGTFTVKGGGADVWGTADAFQFAYRTVEGDATVTARVAAIGGTEAWTKVGVMIRGTTAPGSAQAFMLASVGKGLAFQRRLVDGGMSIHTPASTGTAAPWVRLQRIGTTVVASMSVDGTTWMEVGRDTIALGSAALIGLAVSSHTTAALATGTFDNVAITPMQLSDLTITAPLSASTLRTTTITFEWSGTGDEFWLEIGSAAGRADLYASGSLGQQRQHTVSGLPLNGTTLFVQVRRRIGTATGAAVVHYTAPIRKGLAVITDFADRRLEDYAGPGMNNIDEVSAQLREMEAHWAWLSRGRERIQWDIIRVTLPQRCVADAFSNWVEFRTAVAGLVRQQVTVADYDVQGDGTIDSAWLIVSSGGTPPEPGCAPQIDHFALGGSSANGGVAMFVDGQASGSVIARATGNFNHEFGHLMGLVDMYGTYDTVHGLTLMSDSWPVPPQDFAARERIKMGWLEPRLLTETTREVWLPSANETFAAVKIPTAMADEYFLIEYRKRPDTGYGSRGPFFNGLAVYHVLEGSSMWQDPPIVKLEPADGRITAGDGLNQADFVYPENPYLLRPLVLRSYFGDGPEVLRIENVAWRDGGIVFDVAIAGAADAPANLLVNGSFESGAAGNPTGWTRSASAGVFTYPSPIAFSGASSVMLESASPNDMWWSQSVALMTEHTYKLCGWLKGDAIGPPGGTGGSMSLVGALGGWVGSPGLVGTFDWTQGCIMFATDATTSRVDVACRLGHYLERVSGRLWCDDMTLVPVRSAF